MKCPSISWEKEVTLNEMFIYIMGEEATLNEMSIYIMGEQVTLNEMSIYGISWENKLH
jgi:hypothetical protein